MSSGFNDRDLEKVRQSLLRDLEHAPINAPPLSLHDSRTGATSGPESTTLVEFVNKDAPGVWMRFGSHTMRLHALDCSELSVTLASEVQDDVIGLAGRPWPEVLPEVGNRSLVLSPTLAENGGAVWSGAGRRQSPIGSLNTLSAFLVD